VARGVKVKMYGALERQRTILISEQRSSSGEAGSHIGRGVCNRSDPAESLLEASPITGNQLLRFATHLLTLKMLSLEEKSCF